MTSISSGEYATRSPESGIPPELIFSAMDGESFIGAVRGDLFDTPSDGHVTPDCQRANGLLVYDASGNGGQSIQ